MPTVTVSDFRAFGPAAAFTDLSDAVIEFWLNGAEDFAASYIGGHGYGPLLTTSRDYQAAIFKIAAWDLLVNVRGISPNSEGHLAMKLNWDAARDWLRDVARGVANIAAAAPARTVSGVAGVFDVSADPGSNTTEGW